MKTVFRCLDELPVVPYIYNYPPTRLYAPQSAPQLADLICTPRVHLYIHIPFCEQRCTFCGYLTVIDAEQRLRKRYIEAVCTELWLYAPILEKHTIGSVNFGGGTPSLLTADEIAQILLVLRRINPRLMLTATEISIEATPETITLEKCQTYRTIGIERVSIGVQTFDDSEIATVKRGNTGSTSHLAIDMLKRAGFRNVCADLMYGLPGQTRASWQRSVETLIALRPATVELYSTVLIPGTALARQGVSFSDKEKRCWYDLAREKFLAAGYLQDCHIRFVLPGQGGYEQQAGVYALESLIGVGVGARSYTDRFQYRNLYDTRRSRHALMRYVACLENGNLPIESGIYLDEEERMRRYLIHQFEALSSANFIHRFDQSVEEIFPEEVATLLDAGCWKKVEGGYACNPEFLRYRDTFARNFFSPQALRRERDHASELVTLRR